MTDEPGVTGLGAALHRATDAIEAPGLAPGALGVVRRRRTRNRGVAVAATAAAVAAVIVATQLPKGPQTIRPVGPSTPTVAPAPSQSPTASGPKVTVRDQGEVRRLNPQRVDDLPDAPSRWVPEIPSTLDPPSDVPDLADSPIGAALLASNEGGVVRLMSPAGDWRRLDLPAEGTWFVDLSPDGTRLVAWEHAGTTAVAYDLGDGTPRTVAQPAATVGYETSGWRWIDEERLLLTSYVGRWLVDAADSSAVQVPYPSQNAAWAVDDDGEVVESADRSRPELMTDWAGGRAREVSLARAGRIERFDVNGDRVAATALEVPWEGREVFALIVADRQTMSPVHLLEVVGPGNYRDGPLSVLALRDDGTVLIHVGIVGRSPRGRILAWRPAQRELAVVTRTAPDVGSLVFAEQLLRSGAL